MNEPNSSYCFRCGLPFDGGREGISGWTAAGQPMGFWIRFAAYIIDGILLGVVSIIVITSVFGEDYFSPNWGWSDFVDYLINAAYFTIAVALWSTTIGKRIFGMVVVRMDGSKVGVGRAFVRYLAYMISAVILCIGFIMIGFRTDKRGLHDLICDTQVVKRVK